MAHLLHIDSSITGERSISRRLTARAAAAWRAAHPDGTVTYRDLGQSPLPHLDAASGLARMVPPDQHTPEQQASWQLTQEVVAEVKQADTVLLGLPLYNYGPPSSVKSWVDHLIAPGIAYDPVTNAGLLGDRQFVVLVSRGGGHPAGGLGPRRAVAAARPLPDRAGAAVHLRRAHPGPGQPGDGRADPAVRAEPRRGRAGRRRAVGARLGGRLTGPRHTRRAGRSPAERPALLV
ncbi:MULTISPECIES: FMN-dependent NADH-azoreductase [unclassified Micromonospora]|uniref:FMN-dependent NADH-azoreductase n=1 Tax=unclassified Micromonospora TaxID=2617518 RepID=UPI002FF0AE6D